MLKIVKHFEIGIVGAYQPYKFGTTIESNHPEEDIDINAPEDKLVHFSDQLFGMAAIMVQRDIETFIAGNPEFAIVFSARTAELEKVKKYLDNQAAMRRRGQ